MLDFSVPLSKNVEKNLSEEVFDKLRQLTVKYFSLFKLAYGSWYSNFSNLDTNEFYLRPWTIWQVAVKPQLYHMVFIDSRAPQNFHTNSVLNAKYLLIYKAIARAWRWALETTTGSRQLASDGSTSGGWPNCQERGQPPVKQLKWIPTRMKKYSISPVFYIKKYLLCRRSILTTLNNQ